MKKRIYYKKEETSGCLEVREMFLCDETGYYFKDVMGLDFPFFFTPGNRNNFNDIDLIDELGVAELDVDDSYEIDERENYEHQATLLSKRFPLDLILYIEELENEETLTKVFLDGALEKEFIVNVPMGSIYYEGFIDYSKASLADKLKEKKDQFIRSKNTLFNKIGEESASKQVDFDCVISEKNEEDLAYLITSVGCSYVIEEELVSKAKRALSAGAPLGMFLYANSMDIKKAVEESENEIYEIFDEALKYEDRDHFPGDPSRYRQTLGDIIEKFEAYKNSKMMSGEMSSEEAQIKKRKTF